VVDIGFGLLTGQVPLDRSTRASESYPAMADFASLADEEGFSSVWASEHHFAADAYLPSILPLLANIAGRTRRVALGAATLLAPFHQPLRLAEDAATVDLLSNGRLILGLGLGWRHEEFRAFGIPPADRARRLEDLIEILRRAWKGERFSYTGHSTSFTEIRIDPFPERPIPIWLGGSAPPALRRVGRVADGFIASRCQPPELAERLRLVDEAALAAGRPGLLPVAVMVDAWVGQPSDAVIKGAWAATDIYQAWRDNMDTPDQGVHLPDRTGSNPDPLLKYGEPSQLIEQMRPYVRLLEGRNATLCVRLSYPGVPRQLTEQAIVRFGREVIPLVSAMQ
jgi:probable F420-dependent oxidoreductase